MNTTMASQGDSTFKDMQEHTTPPSPVSSSEGGSSRDWSPDPDHYSDSSGDEGPQNSTVVGRRITQAYNGGDTDLVTEEDGIFNTTDDDDSDEINSNASSAYEELADLSRVIERVEYAASSSEDTDTDMQDSSYVPSSDDEGEEAEDDEEGGEDGEDEANVENTEHKAVAIDTFDEGKKAVSDAESFAKLQKTPSPPDVFLLNQLYERAQWRILELEEIKRTVERELVEAVEKQESLGKELDESHEKFYFKIERIGISRELWDEYQAFCESMEPEFGSVSGWSIACDENHQGSYVGYDPEFALFKEHSELPWDQYNFRCEPNQEPDWEMGKCVLGTLVEFWPVEYPSITAQATSTWGDVYPRLYDLATKSARAGSEAALDLIVTLPDREATCKGGWLFEYYTEHQPTTRDKGFSVSDEGFTWTKSPIDSRRWTYRSAHKVDTPEDAETRRKRIQKSLSSSV